MQGRPKLIDPAYVKHPRKGRGKYIKEKIGRRGPSDLVEIIQQRVLLPPQQLTKNLGIV
jgi:hypothetical protein